MDGAAEGTLVTVRQWSERGVGANHSDLVSGAGILAVLYGFLVGIGRHMCRRYISGLPKTLRVADGVCVLCQ